MSIRWCALLAALVAAGGCSGDRTTSPATAPSGAVRSIALAADDTSDLILTPGGLYHRSCVHEVPDGAIVGANGVIRRRDGTAFQVQSCATPGPVSVSGLGGSLSIGFGSPTLPGPHQSVEDGEASAGTGHTFRYISARWVVPPYPGTPWTSGDHVLFFFPALENSNTIIQPVLQYGYNNEFGGAYWTIASWMCGPDCFHSVPHTVSVGDVLGGYVEAQGCGGGLCGWLINTVDSTQDYATSVGIAAGDFGQANDQYTTAFGGTAEVHGLTDCSQWPGGGFTFSQIAVANELGSTSPSWLHHVTNPSSDTPQCGFGVTSTSTQVSLADSLAPLLTALVSGPTSVASGASGTWNAVIGAVGTPPYTYAWGGILGGTSSSVTGVPTGTGYLTLRVIDAAHDTANASLFVTVCDPGVITC